jgi:phosphoribosylanthranilate isomerase
MLIKLKICGIFRDEDVDYLNEFQPDFAGFVFAKSKRRVTSETARRLILKLSDEIIPVGVFVNETAEKIAETANETGIKMIQLHGEESEDFIETLKSKTHLPIIKAIKPNMKIAENADFLLFDGEYPGSGRPFDKSALPRTNKPFFIAGGINAVNINEAIALSPYGIDLSSGVETNGVKDREKIKEICEIIKHVDNIVKIRTDCCGD